ncbi:Nup192p ASCRUDRAFT_7161 [Ascoidea rubescens DSM 1968]|uniref:Uncharacterized protein n=1 Tax=Ascoidea rubescens DSM 1968 TaxID=1344418 RepID=A0A1D2VM26_9ASCO|nr:hypothetical protein ASCRUDRAFT_7161 [Ascoidea rubescens DSM 1968]ODV62617.1 hypothetical protein ASCRUDRAFT_7161 [Ascoidea rubescens DSM 1968]
MASTLLKVANVSLSLAQDDLELHWDLNDFRTLYQLLQVNTHSSNKNNNNGTFNIDRNINKTNVSNANYLLKYLKNDFNQLILFKRKNVESRNKISNGEISINKIDYKLNNSFQLLTIQLSDFLNLDEIISANILLNTLNVYNKNTNNDNNNQNNNINDLFNSTKGTSLIDLAIIYYFKRNELLLLIYSYLVFNPSNYLVTDFDLSIDKVLNSFKEIEFHLDHIKDQIIQNRLLSNSNNLNSTINNNNSINSTSNNGGSLLFNNNNAGNNIPNFNSISNNLNSNENIKTNTNNDAFLLNINYKRKQLFNQYQILSQILYSFLKDNNILNDNKKNKNFSFIDSFLKNKTLFKSTQNNDLFIIFYFPGIIAYFNTIFTKNSSSQIEQIYTHFQNEYKNYSQFDQKKNQQQSSFSSPSSPSSTYSSLSNPYYSAVSFIFLTYLLNYSVLIKKNKNFNSKNSIYQIHSIQNLILDSIKISSIETLMSIMADVLIYSSSNNSSFDLSNLIKSKSFINFRNLLQKHLPILIPYKFLNDNPQSISNALFNNQDIQNNNIIGSDHLNRYQIEIANYKIDENFKTLLSCQLIQVVTLFIKNSSNLLNKISDFEEDFLLSNLNSNQIENSSGNNLQPTSLISINNNINNQIDSNIQNNISMDLNLDEITEIADLERLHMLIYYINILNPNLTDEWFNKLNIDIEFDSKNISNDNITDIEYNNGENDSNNDNTMLDFIYWGLVKSNTTLMKSCYCLMISSFINDSKTALNFFQILNDGILLKTMLSDNSTESKKNKNNQTTSPSFLMFQSNSTDMTTLQVNRNTNIDKLSIKSIFEILKNYNNQLIHFSNQFQQQQQQQKFQQQRILLNGNSNDAPAKVLSETSVYEISAYLSLFSKIASLSDDFKKLMTKNSNFNIINICFTFLKSKECNFYGSVFQTLKSLISKDLNVSYKIWNLLDSWIFEHNLYNVDYNNGLMNHSLKFKEIFDRCFKNFNDLLGFVELLNQLISSNYSTQSKLSLPYPKNLGSKYRKAGIWPYVEYLLSEVFVNLNASAVDVGNKKLLQISILNFISNCFKFLDPNLILFSQLSGVDNIDILGKNPEDNSFSIDFNKFLLENPCSAVMNYLYQPKVYHVLFGIISERFDDINLKEEGDLNVISLSSSLSIINNIIELERTFIDIILPCIRFNNKFGFSTYLPKNIGLFGITSIIEPIISNLSIIINLSLYIGSTHLKISSESVKILSKLSVSRECTAVSSKISGKTKNSFVQGNRLLTAIQTFDVNSKVRYSFINQLESHLHVIFHESLNNISGTSKQLINLKLDILRFLDINLSSIGQEKTISHYLLGIDFNTHSKNPFILSSYDVPMISGESSLLNYILSMFDYFLEMVENKNNASNEINYIAIKFLSMIMEIILKLIKNELTSGLVLKFLRNHNFEDKIISINLRTTLKATKFSGNYFNNDFNNFDNKFSFDDSSSDCFFLFFKLKCFIMEYIIIELNEDNNNEDNNERLNKLLNYLIKKNDFSKDFIKINSYFDFSEFNVKLKPESKAVKNLNYFKKINLESIIEWIEFSSDDSNHSDKKDCFNIKTLNLLLELRLKASITEKQLIKASEKKKSFFRMINDGNNNINSLIPSSNESADIIKKDDKNVDQKQIGKEENQDIYEEMKRVKEFILNINTCFKVQKIQSRCLKTWIKLIENILIKNELKAFDRCDFILVLYQLIIPKINYYVENNITYAEELTSLSLLLFNLHYKDFISNNNDDDRENDNHSGDRDSNNTNVLLFCERLFPLFKTCLNSILNFEGSGKLRCNLYLLINQFLLSVLEDKKLSLELLNSTKFSNDKLTEILIKDFTENGGLIKIISLTLLQTLYLLGEKNEKNNLILQLILRKKFVLKLLAKLIQIDKILLSSDGLKNFKSIDVSSYDTFNGSNFDTNSNDNKENKENKIIGSSNDDEDDTSILNYVRYELTVFKTIIIFLISISRNKKGCNILIKDNFFKELKKIQLLKFDLEVGIEIEYISNGETFGKILNNNLNLLEYSLFNNSNDNFIFPFEIAIPIFQLVSTVLITVGPNNRFIVKEIKDILDSYKEPISKILKKHLLINDEELKRRYFHKNQKPKLSDNKMMVLKYQQVVDVIALLAILTEYIP